MTAVTDATPQLSPGTVALLAAAAADGRLPQRIRLLGAPPSAPPPAPLAAGPWKIVVADHELPSPDELAERIAAAHRAGRPVALHVVTRAALVLALAAFDTAGTSPGDRLEHASVLPAELLTDLRRLGLRVVTQPGFVAERGDRYLAEVEPADRPDLYRFASLLRAGIPAAPSSDAPYGPLDPWLVLRAARDRVVPDGAGTVLGAAERVDVATALAGYLSGPAQPGGPPRTVEIGAPADLVLLATGWRDALAAPSADLVRRTLIGGTPAGAPRDR